MSQPQTIRVHEVSFCADVKSWADALFRDHPEWPFSGAAIEEFVEGTTKRHDVRFYRRGSQTPVLCGEVKMPGTPEGRSPFDPDLMQEAFLKADQIQAPFFFTWNVNRFVLFDRSRWNRPMIERRIKDWDLSLHLTTAADCRRADVQAYIRDRFLVSLFTEFAGIVDGSIGEWGLPPDDVFIRSLESHLDWPVIGTRDYLATTASKDPGFAARLRAWMAEDMSWTFDPDRPESWRMALDNAARSLSYVFCNRTIFYEALRAKFPDLEALRMPAASHRHHTAIYRYFRLRFEAAMLATGDYEPIFYPQVEDEWGSLIFASETSCQGWRGVLRNLGEYNFRRIPHDVVGGIFQKLIAPEERQKFGQYFTNEDIVDVINAFCIRRAGDAVIDPACGSGSFLVRAYHRKAWLSRQRAGGRRHQDRGKSHEDLLREIYGSDIALFAAHLATLNLAARDIKEDENYPLIARRNFFEIPDDRQSFCHVPGLREADGSRRQVPVALPELDAVIGNPPYVRQELIPKRKDIVRSRDETKAAFEARRKSSKEYVQELCERLWPGLKLSGRSDFHCYFWPAAASLIKEGGYFGFLTSSSWLDVEYGFALQGWILTHFRLVAVMESVDEPWFTDARVKTAVTILQRCGDAEARDGNLVKFVRFQRPIAEILGNRPHGDEQARQMAAERLRECILHAETPFANDRLRIMPIPQARLWKEGVKAADMVSRSATDSDSDDEETDDICVEEAAMNYLAERYVAGKWGRFLRAPDLYFALMKNYGDRFVRLGEIAEIRWGITSGCDAFFMPRDATDATLARVRAGLSWNEIGLMTPCQQKEVETGSVRIVRAGDNTLHPIEIEFVRPEVHSLMDVTRPVIHARDLDRVVLWVDQPLRKLSGTYAGKYIRWGAKQTFASKKSKAVPVPQRSTCASRPLWYDLTTEKVGIAFWPKSQQYRHTIPINPDKLMCNCNLYTLIPQLKTQEENRAVGAILNSTVVALWKCFFGRYAGTEGNLKTEVIDTLLLEIPDPRGISTSLAARLSKAFQRLNQRDVTYLVDDAMRQCHSVDEMREILKTPATLPPELRQRDRRDLDDAVLELIGVAAKAERNRIIDELYACTVEYYRLQRTLEIQGARNRAGGGRSVLSPNDLAGSIWNSLDEPERGPAVVDWIAASFRRLQTVDIPDGKADALGPGDMFNATTVIFRSKKESHACSYASTEQALLVADLAALDIRGTVRIPTTSEECAECKAALASRMLAARERFAALAASRTGTESLQEKVASLLTQWHIHGRDRQLWQLSLQ